MNWTSKVDGLYIKAYFEKMFEEGSTYFFGNVRVELYLLEVDDFIFPVTVPIPYEKQSYVASPYTQYIRYTIEELRELNSPFLENVLKAVLQTIGIMLRRGKLDQVVIVNNWLLSTNLHHQLKKETLKTMADFLVKKFPNHAVMFRSLTSYFHKDMMGNLRDLQFQFIPSRSIYIFNPEEFGTLNKRHRKNIKQDIQFLQNSGYTVVEHENLSLDDLIRVRELYNLLYLEKYSYLNPQFTTEFFINAWKNRLLEFKALRKNGTIYGAVGFFYRGGTMTTPILGYDTALGKEEGLYKLCSVILTQHSLEKHMVLHRSAGAGSFKRNRGAINTIEFSAVYIKHLPQKKQWVWKFLSQLLNHIGIPILKKFEL